MRRFFIGALVGAGLMYFYLYRYAGWRNWTEGRFDKVGSQYRGDTTHRLADQALKEEAPSDRPQPPRERC
jgi:hypothetical protein